MCLLFLPPTVAAPIHTLFNIRSVAKASHLPPLAPASRILLHSSPAVGLRDLKAQLWLCQLSSLETPVRPALPGSSPEAWRGLLTQVGQALPPSLPGLLPATPPTRLDFSHTNHEYFPKLTLFFLASMSLHILFPLPGMSFSLVCLVIFYLLEDPVQMLPLPGRLLCSGSAVHASRQCFLRGCARCLFPPPDSLHPHLFTWGLVHGQGSTAGGEVVSVALRLREDFCVEGERRAALGALWHGR